MRKAVVIASYAAAGVVLLTLLAPWYSTPRYCIQLAGFSCPQSQRLGTGVQVALLLATVLFAVLLMLALVSRVRAAYIALTASAVTVACVVGYCASTKPDINTGLPVGLDSGFYVAAAAATVLLLTSIALAAMGARR